MSKIRIKTTISIFQSIHNWLRSKPRLWVLLEWVHKNVCGCVDIEEILVSYEGRWQLYDQEHLITKAPEWFIPWDWERHAQKYSPADLFTEDEDEEYWGWTARPIVPKYDPETGSLLLKFKDLEPSDLI